MLVSLSRIEQYRAECDFFKKKNAMSMKECESHLHGKRGSENFEKEDDINDWQFPLEALKWWEERIKELQDFVDN